MLTKGGVVQVASDRESHRPRNDRTAAAPKRWAVGSYGDIEAVQQVIPSDENDFFAAY